MENLIPKAERYFELFASKNVKGLENEIYSDNTTHLPQLQTRFPTHRLLALV